MGRQPHSLSNITRESPRASRAEGLFRQALAEGYRATDHVLAGLLVLHWLLCIGIALVVAPSVWVDAAPFPQIHAWTSLGLGAALALPSAIAALFWPGCTLTRHMIAASLVAFSAVLIHLTGGRPETHFHVFGALAFLSLYRDSRVLITATVTLAIDHTLRGIYWPQSVYGIGMASNGRSVEYIGWAVFETCILIINCMRNLKDLRLASERRADAEHTLTLSRRAMVIATETHSVDDALAACLDLGCELTGWPVGHAWILADDSDDDARLVSSGIWRSPPEMDIKDFRSVTEKLRFEHGVGLPGRVMRMRSPVWIRNVQVDDNFPRAKLCHELHFKGALGFPIMIDGKIAAVVEFFHIEELEPDPALLEALSGILGQVGRVLERRRAEHDLLARDERFRLVVRATNDAVWDWDIATNAICWADDLRSIFGYNASDLGKDASWWLDALHPDDRQRVIDKLYESISQGVETWSDEFRFRCADGSYATVLDRGSVMRDDAGKPVRMIGALSDITERKRAERQLREHADQLQAYIDEIVTTNTALDQAKCAAEAGAQAKSDFLANMSHEIRTPMAAILGFTDELLEAGDLSKAPPARVEALRTIQRNGHHLLQLIDEILDLSKLEAGTLEIQRVPCSPCGLLDDVCAKLSGRAAEKGLELQIVRDGPMPDLILSDPMRIKQALNNLIGNAIKFSNAGDIRIAASFDRENNQTRYSITDQGIGMTQDQIARLFQPFSQADTSMSRRFGGTGLGLVITKRIAELLGGDIRVTSQLGIGSTFELTVFNGQPRAAKNSTASERSAAPVPAPTREPQKINGAILLVEDGPDNQRLIAAILKRAGADVEVVENGLLGVESCIKATEIGRPFGLVLMDMQMPVMDGYTATRTLRERGYTGTIVALTAHAMSGERERCIRAGCDDYLTKPIDRHVLIDSVAKFLSQQSESRAAIPA